MKVTLFPPQEGLHVGWGSEGAQLWIRGSTAAVYSHLPALAAAWQCRAGTCGGEEKNHIFQQLHFANQETPG